MGAHDDQAADRSRLERVVGTCVLVPVGAALHAGSALPSLVRRTRGQLATAKVVGRFAVQQGTAVAEGVLAQVQEQAVSLLARGGPPAPPAGDEVPDDEAAAGEPSGTDPAASEHDVGHGAAREDLGPPPDPSGLAIPDYDSLSASQVVPRLESLTPAELEAIRSYEARTRARRTILAKVAQLESS